jgi:hypothetical protein
VAGLVWSLGGEHFVKRRSLQTAPDVRHHHHSIEPRTPHNRHRAFFRSRLRLCFRWSEDTCRRFAVGIATGRPIRAVQPVTRRKNFVLAAHCVFSGSMGCRQAIFGRPKHHVAGWSSPVAREAHNLEVAGSNPVPATFFTPAGPSWPLRACFFRRPPAAVASTVLRGQSHPGPCGLVFFGGLLPPWRQPCCGGRAILAPAGLFFFRRPPAAVASTVLRGQGHPGPCGLVFSAAGSLS